ncbi:transcriptional regulator [Pseudonocardiaceae bacterium YIM PH 21723]|nr:transcriptional regulator [Pseudonocardiaceae bacterium YIM PH 21723]
MRAERLVALLFTLQSRRSATIGELAEALDVSERTMSRDVAALQAAGVPLWTEPGRHGGVRLVDGWRSRLDGLTSREAVAIFAMGVPRALTELGLGTAVSAAHAKVAAAMPAALRDQAQHLAQRFHLDAPGWFRDPDSTEQLAVLARAVWEQHRVLVGYRGKERELEPLGLVLKAGSWYLVAGVEDTVRTYRVGRVEWAEPLDEHFDRPADFDLAGWWARSSAEFAESLVRTRVLVRLSPQGVRTLPAVLGADQAVVALAGAGAPDAEGWIEVELGLEEPHIAADQLLPLGAGVEILSPPAVRAEFADLARRMADRHR